MALGGLGGMLPSKMFEILGAVGQYVLFEQFLWQILFNFFAPIPLSFSPNMIHFVRTFSMYARLRRKDCCYQRVKKYQFYEIS